MMQAGQNGRGDNGSASLDRLSMWRLRLRAPTTKLPARGEVSYVVPRSEDIDLK